MQEDKFKTELDCAQQNRRLPTKSSLLRLVPFIDTSGLLRVGGRLQNSILEYNERHPVILPGNSPLTRCYLEHVHRITLDGGIQLMRSHLALSVWITNGLRVLGVYHRCVTCTRYQVCPSQQRMAPLPEDCVTPTRIFEVSGVDFAGPFALRISKGPGSKRMKGYVCIFVAAVYIEVITGLAVDDFLAVYSRFTGRMGVCRIIYSDNATTFKAASKELTRLLQEALQMKGGIVDDMASQDIQLLTNQHQREAISSQAPRFSPPPSPQPLSQNLSTFIVAGS
ncbi:hypothetical protein TKK_0001690 [Trichogramma kaykai]